jgi:hypothetical protein
VLHETRSRPFSTSSCCRWLRYGLSHAAPQARMRGPGFALLAAMSGLARTQMQTCAAKIFAATADSFVINRADDTYRTYDWLALISAYQICRQSYAMNAPEVSSRASADSSRRRVGHHTDAHTTSSPVPIRPVLNTITSLRSKAKQMRHRPRESIVVKVR